MNDAQFLSVAWNQLIQVSLLTVSVWLLTKIFARNRPHLAHAMWLVVLAKCVTPPLLASPTGLFGHLSVPEPVWFEPEEIVVEEAIEPVIPEPRVVASNPEFESEIVVDPLSQGYVLEDDFLLGQLMLEDTAFELHDEPVESVAAISKPPVAEPSVTFLPLWKLWLISAGTVMSLIFLRVMCTLWRVKRHRTETPPELLELVQKLSKQFGLRRRVRVLITSSRVGPAVVGLFRPLLILPEVVTNGRSAKELEPIVAHELLHVRRGDLGIGWLQVLVQSLWWFHPLVWLVNRLLNRETERCCDEAVLAELNCSPGVYARCLLNVLEQKRNLTPIPAFPGVKPVELTKQRMERIMKLGQGCRKKSPWWCWLVVLLLGAVVLPGRVSSQGQETVNQISPSIESFSYEVTGGTTLNPDSSTVGEQSVRKYDVSELLTSLSNKYELSSDHARNALAVLTESSLIASTPSPVLREGVERPAPKCDCSENQLIVRGSEEQHRTVSGLVSLWTEHGICQVEIVLAYATFAEDFDPQIFSEPNDGKQRVCTTKLLSSEESKALMEQLQGHPQTNILFLPKVIVFQGAKATITNQVQKPFVVGLKGDRPQMRVFAEGLEVGLKPIVRDDHTQLDCTVQHSKILDVKSSQVQRTPASKPVSIQLPDVRQTKFSLSALLEEGQMLMIGGLEPIRESKEKKQFAIFLRATVKPLEWGSLSMKPSDEQLLFGTGVNSDAGVTGSVVLDESNFAWQPAQPASGLPDPAKPWTKKTWAWLKHTPAWKKYDREISVSFDQIPLKQAIEQICAAGDLEVMFFEDDKDVLERISKKGYPNVMCFENDLVYDLAEEPISLSVPVTFLAEKKAAIPILEDILEPFGLGLGHMNGMNEPGGCFEIRTKAFLDRTGWTVIYPVGDLLEKDQNLQAGPTRGVRVLDKTPHQEKLFKAKVLIEALEKALTWDHSEANTANGTMKFRESSEALVIQCDRAQHDLIEKWLRERRKLCGIEITPATPNDDRGPGVMPFLSPNPIAATQEQRTGRLLHGTGVNSEAGVTGSIVLEERHFDLRSPLTFQSNEVLQANRLSYSFPKFNAEQRTSYFVELTKCSNSLRRVAQAKYVDTPRSEVLRDLQRKTGSTFIIERGRIADAEEWLKKPISIEISSRSGLSLRSILRMVLQDEKTLEFCTIPGSGPKSGNVKPIVLISTYPQIVQWSLQMQSQSFPHLCSIEDLQKKKSGEIVRFIEERLNQPIAVKFENNKLSDAFKEISNKAGISIHLELVSLPETLSANSPVKDYQAEAETSLREVLEEICAPLGLIIVVQDEMLKIIGKESYEQRTIQVVYPFSKLLGNGAGAYDRLQEVSDRIKATIEPDSWTKENGYDVEISKTTTSLVVRHKRKTHEAIAELLSKVRLETGVNRDTEVKGRIVSDDSFEPVEAKSSEDFPRSVMPNLQNDGTPPTVQIRFQKPEKARLRIVREAEGRRVLSQYELPVRQNFRAGGQSFRLSFDNIPGRSITSEWPVPYRTSRAYSWSLEVPESTEQSRKYLSHNAVPVALTDEDLDQIDAGNLVTKVVYLPHPDRQELAIANVETIVSTRLDPSKDAVEEAKKRGTIVAVMRSLKQNTATESWSGVLPPVWFKSDPTPKRLEWTDGAWKIQSDELTEARKADQPEPGNVITKVYPVADLVLPIPGTESDPVESVPILSKLPHQSKLFNAKKKPLSESAQPLIDLIRKSIEPESWSGEKSVGTIAFHEEKLSLVVRHKESVHQKVSELLTSLRRKQDLQVTLECLTVQFEKDSFSDFWTNVGIVIDHADASAKNSMKPLIFHGVKRDDFRSKIDQFEAAQVLSFPKVTVFNGIGAQIQISGAGADEDSVPMMHYMIVPTISEDRRTIDVKFAVNAANTLDALTKAKSMTIPDGTSVLIEVTDELLSGQKRTGVPEVDKALRELKKKELGLRTFVLLTPRIIIQEEEEELLGIPQSKAEQPASDSNTRVGTVTPRIIIQEEEEALLELPQPEAEPKHRSPTPVPANPSP